MLKEKYVIDMPDEIRKEILWAIMKHMPVMSIGSSDAQTRNMMYVLETVAHSIGHATHYSVKNSFSPNAGPLMKYLKTNDPQLYKQLTPFFSTTSKEFYEQK